MIWRSCKALSIMTSSIRCWPKAKKRETWCKQPKPWSRLLHNYPNIVCWMWMHWPWIMRVLIFLRNWDMHWHGVMNIWISWLKPRFPLPSWLRKLSLILVSVLIISLKLQNSVLPVCCGRTLWLLTIPNVCVIAKTRDLTVSAVVLPRWRYMLKHLLSIWHCLMLTWICFVHKQKQCLLHWEA